MSWSNSSGAAVGFSWENGFNDGADVQSPIFNNNGFTFTPSAYLASASSVATDSFGQGIHVTLTPESGRHITSILATFTGDYVIVGNGSVGYTAVLQATKNGGGPGVSNAIAPPDITTSQFASGIFKDSVTLAVPDALGKVDVFFNAPVHATAGQDAVAQIQMKLIDLNVTTAANAIPLPAAIATFPIGAAMVAFATRRMKKAV